jgi:hypothetical protein
VTGSGATLVTLAAGGQVAVHPPATCTSRGSPSQGDAGSVAVDPSNGVYWNLSEAWPSADAPAYPYLISLDPGV